MTFFEATFLFLSFAHRNEVPVLSHRAPFVAWAAHAAVAAEGPLFHDAIDPIEATEALLLRIAYLESRGDWTAKNAQGDVGIAQIRSEWFDGHSEAEIRRDPILGFRLALRALQTIRTACGGRAQRWLGAFASGKCDGAPLTARRRCAPLHLCDAT